MPWSRPKASPRFMQILEGWRKRPRVCGSGFPLLAGSFHFLMVWLSCAHVPVSSAEHFPFAHLHRHPGHMHVHTHTHMPTSACSPSSEFEDVGGVRGRWLHDFKLLPSEPPWPSTADASPPLPSVFFAGHIPRSPPISAHTVTPLLSPVFPCHTPTSGITALSRCG